MVVGEADAVPGHLRPAGYHKVLLAQEGDLVVAHVAVQLINTQPEDGGQVTVDPRGCGRPDHLQECTPDVHIDPEAQTGGEAG